MTITQKDLAAALGIDPALVTRDKARGMPTDDIEAARAWRAAHKLPRARANAPPGIPQAGLDLARERALLLREQRREVALRVLVAERKFAPVELLGAALAAAAATTADKLGALPGELRRACPDLPPEALETVARTVAALRGEWAAAALAAASDAASAFDQYPAEEPTDDDSTPDT